MLFIYLILINVFHGYGNTEFQNKKIYYNLEIFIKKRTSQLIVIVSKKGAYLYHKSKKDYIKWKKIKQRSVWYVRKKDKNWFYLATSPFLYLRRSDVVIAFK